MTPTGREPLTEAWAKRVANVIRMLPRFTVEGIQPRHEGTAAVVITDTKDGARHTLTTHAEWMAIRRELFREDEERDQHKGEDNMVVTGTAAFSNATDRPRPEVVGNTDETGVVVPGSVRRDAPQIGVPRDEATASRPR